MDKVARLIFYSILGEIVTVLLLTLLNSSHSQPKLIISPLAKPVSAKNIKFNELISPTPELQLRQLAGENTQNKKTNILLLGLDARKGDSRPRCDSMHMISVDSLNETIVITTVPRGIVIPAKNLATQSAYLGNTCHTFGIDYTVKTLEKITGIHPDYIVKVGFSQTLGLLRYINLPTTETLQFLRNRRYGIGDYQRSHNQALFIKDLMMTKIEQLAHLPKPIKYLMFKTLDTTMDFDQAENLVDEIIKNGIHNDPDNIILVTKPDNSGRIADIHFGNLTAGISGQRILAATANNEYDFKIYQNNLISSLENLILRANKLVASNKNSAAFQLIKIPFSQKLWLQVENDSLRYHLQYELLRIYVLTSPDKSNLSGLLLDYLVEMEGLGQNQYYQMGQELLSNFQSKYPIN